MSKKIFLKYNGRLGNRLFQYCLARIISNKLEKNLLINKNESLFNRRKKDNWEDDTPLNEYKKSKTIDDDLEIFKNLSFNRLILEPPDIFNNLIKTIKCKEFKNYKIELNDLNNLSCSIVLNGSFQNYKYYKDHKDKIKNWLSIDKKLNILPGENDIVLHHRSGDITPGVYPNKDEQKKIKTEKHHICPFSYYTNILDKISYNNVWIVAQDKNNNIVQDLKKKYNAKVISGYIIDDFLFMKNAKKIILSVSTLCWWAAWLSDATEIHYPLIGYWHPKTKQKCDLRVYDEKRYIYHDIVNEKYFLKYSDTK
jgi:hypothetical protein